MKYILNSPILTTYGTFKFRKVNLYEAQCFIKEGHYISAVGHEATAELMSKILGGNIPWNRIKVEMKPGDTALVFRLLTRLEEGKVLSSEELSRVKYELGLLEMVE